MELILAGSMNPIVTKEVTATTAEKGSPLQQEHACRPSSQPTRASPHPPHPCRGPEAKPSLSWASQAQLSQVLAQGQEDSKRQFLSPAHPFSSHRAVSQSTSSWVFTHKPLRQEKKALQKKKKKDFSHLVVNKLRFKQ